MNAPTRKLEAATQLSRFEISSSRARALALGISVLAGVASVGYQFAAGGAIILLVLPWALAILILHRVTPSPLGISALTSGLVQQLAALFVLCTALTAGYYTLDILISARQRFFVQTPLESSVYHVACIAALVVTGAIVLVVSAIRRLLVNGRSAGYIPQSSYADVLISAAIAGCMVLGWGLFVGFEITDRLSGTDTLTGYDLERIRSSITIIPISISMPLVYCVVRIMLPFPMALEWSWSGRRMRLCRLEATSDQASKSIWLVFDRPLTTWADRRLVHRIHRELFDRRARLTLVAPHGTTMISDHVLFADQLERLRALYPRTEAELRDWASTLPPADRPESLLFRQLHPSVELLGRAVVELSSQRDLILLVATQEADLAHWQGRQDLGSMQVLFIGSAPSESVRALGCPIHVWNPEDSRTEYTVRVSLIGRRYSRKLRN